MPSEIPSRLRFPRPALARLATFAALLAVGALGSTGSAQAQAQAQAQATEGSTQPPPLPPEQEAFWGSIESLCGKAFERIDAPYIMHVRQCFAAEIRIPVHVQDPDTGVWDRSRTWILTRSEAGIRLKHDHRHDDGSEDTVTQYGGDTDEVGTADIQTFPADEFTKTVIGELVRGADRNIWRMEITPGEVFAYRLTRTTFDQALRWAFDLSRPVSPPPAPWGYENTEPTHGRDAGAP
jgi:hypothetical protein